MMNITNKIASLILSIALGFGLGALTSNTILPGQLASPVDSFKPLDVQLNPFNQKHGGKGR